MENILLFFLAFSGALIVAGGLYAFLVIIGAVTRLMTGTHTVCYLHGYEDVAVLGATFGNLLYLYRFSLPLGVSGAGAFGLFCGIFVGCLAGALTETINVLPVLKRRLHVTGGLPLIISVFALGKLAGTLLGMVK